MLVMMMENQIIEPHQVCQGCLLADRSGQPRWRGGHLTCGHLIRKPGDNKPGQYECEMGFRIANID
ncbi:hypothetical protein [Lyngbya sp. CCY1209]|jgi:hypothetical protein|uniref:hypothetical protein n=1 Tax=Lyngbya sp. CCY1209 TaxID=2886103 RepID=UPI002D201F8C|nr:hypothetical protein [Lyngbya sp. CCY1209]MEB3884763.1 hypothetical protein [Lyngbya sp. CCY1209]